VSWVFAGQGRRRHALEGRCWPSLVAIERPWTPRDGPASARSADGWQFGFVLGEEGVQVEKARGLVRRAVGSGLVPTDGGDEPRVVGLGPCVPGIGREAGVSFR
jgi:hypothetical protein